MTAWNRNSMQLNDLRVKLCDKCQVHDARLTQLAAMLPSVGTTVPAHGSPGAELPLFDASPSQG